MGKITGKIPIIHGKTTIFDGKNHYIWWSKPMGFRLRFSLTPILHETTSESQVLGICFVGKTALAKRFGSVDKTTLRMEIQKRPVF